MKNFLIKIIAISFLGFALLSSCKENEPEPSYIYPSSSFKFLQNQYNLRNGFLINYGRRKYNGGFNINLNLISSGIEIFDKNGVIDKTEGYGHLLFFEMFTKYPDQLETGTYKFDSLYTSDPGTFDSGKGFLNMELPNKTTQTFQISSGTINVLNKNDGEYEITFDCKILSGEEVKGNYIGSLKYYDYSYLDK